MLPIFTKQKIVLTSIIFASIAFLIATFFINGADRGTAWLYIIAIWLVIMAGIEGYSRKKSKKLSKKRSKH